MEKAPLRNSNYVDPYTCIVGGQRWVSSIQCSDMVVLLLKREQTGSEYGLPDRRKEAMEHACFWAVKGRARERVTGWASAWRSVAVKRNELKSGGVDQRNGRV